MSVGGDSEILIVRGCDELAGCTACAQLIGGLAGTSGVMAPDRAEAMVAAAAETWC